MRTTKMLTGAIIAGVVLSGNICYSGEEVDRGVGMADKGSVVTKTGIAIVPHAELEYGAFDYDTGVHGDNSDIGLAVGLTIGKDKNMFDLYGRLSTGGSDNYIKNIGFLYGRKFGRSGAYWAVALEKQSLRETGTGGAYSLKPVFYDSEEIRIKPSFGGSLRKNALFGVGGAGLYLGTADVEFERYEHSGSSFKHYKGNDSITTFGMFCQMKGGYDITDNLAFTASYLVELGMNSGVDLGYDYELGQDYSETGFVFLWYLRAGLQYRF